MGPEFEKGDGRLRPSLQQRLPGAEGPPEEGCTTDHAACGGPLKERKKENGPLPSSAEGPWKKERKKTDNPREGWEEKKERKKTDNPREGWEDGRHRHHTGILRRGQCGASRHLPLGACLFLSLFA